MKDTSFLPALALTIVGSALCFLISYNVLGWLFGYDMPHIKTSHIILVGVLNMVLNSLMSTALLRGFTNEN